MNAVSIYGGDKLRYFKKETFSSRERTEISVNKFIIYSFVYRSNSINGHRMEEATNCTEANRREIKETKSL